MMPSNYAIAGSQLEGCSLIPVRPSTKIPAVVWQPYQSRLPTPEEVELWTTKFAKANVGCVTGAVSGVVVLDVDDPAYFGQVWQETNDGWADGPLVRTPRGFHIWFRHPGNGIRIPNSANAREKIDLRGDGGYVVVPPSKLGDYAYEWIRPFNRDRLPAFPLAWAATKFPSVAAVAKEHARV